MPITHPHTHFNQQSTIVHCTKPQLLMAAYREGGIRQGPGVKVVFPTLTPPLRRDASAQHP